MTSKPVVEHRDIFGKLLSVGDCVCYSSSNTLQVGTIKKINPKMIKVYRIGARGLRYKGELKYPTDLVKVEGPEVTMYLLSRNTSA